jgi:hypothetical protein
MLEFGHMSHSSAAAPDRQGCCILVEAAVLPEIIGPQAAGGVGVGVGEGEGALD